MKIGILAGENSGDLLAAGLMNSIRETYPEADFQGVGGQQMVAAGLKPIAEFQQLSIMGFRDPILKAPRLLALLKRLESYYSNWRPDVFVGVDFNVFNLMLEKRLKRGGLKTVHYVSPSVYAWRRGRIKTVQRSADRILTLFPFEPGLYEAQGMDAVFVGHPLADEIEAGHDVSAASSKARSELGISDSKTVVALLPGSRNSEINLLGRLFLETADQLNQMVTQLYPEKQTMFLVPCPSKKLQLAIQQLAKTYPGLEIKVLLSDARQALAACDIALVKSGTCTLEAMMLGKPMVVSYRMGSITAALVKRLKFGKYVALPNILADRELVPEILQGDARPDVLAKALQSQLASLESEDQGYLDMRSCYLKLHKSLRCNASKRAALSVIEVATGHV